MKTGKTVTGFDTAPSTIRLERDNFMKSVDVGDTVELKVKAKLTDLHYSEGDEEGGYSHKSQTFKIEKIELVGAKKGNDENEGNEDSDNKMKLMFAMLGGKGRKTE